MSLLLFYAEYDANNILIAVDFPEEEVMPLH